MRRLMSRPSPAMLVALIAVVLAATGGAVAAIPDADGTIHGCLGGRGALRVVEPPATCEAGETALDFSQRGQPGATGPAGPPARPSDPTGTTYAEQTTAPAAEFIKKPKPLGKRLTRRLSQPKQEATDAFSVYKDEPVGVGGYGPLAKRMKYVATLYLPAGRWMIVAKSNSTFTGDYYEAGYAECTLVAGGDFDRAWSTNSTLSATLVHRFTTPGRVDLRCAGWLASMTWTKITAVRVGSIKNTPSPL